MTLPENLNAKRVNLFNLANRYRKVGDFEQAEDTYKALLQENADAEAHWGVVTCRYGVEYVRGLDDHDYKPTCHRMQKHSILHDPDYRILLEDYKDDARTSIYREEAKRIDAICNHFHNIIEEETPSDVFICYKERDERGERTEDSIIAQEIYDALTNQKLRVFFARISLEDKLGELYEPHIIAALRSAKVMIVVGTSAENLNAGWVKNEWSRYLELMKQDGSKTLIPVYYHMNPDDMPNQIPRWQAQDWNKIGAKQDIVRGVMKFFPHASVHKDPNATSVLAQTWRKNQIDEAVAILQDKRDWKFTLGVILFLLLAYVWTRLGVTTLTIWLYTLHVFPESALLSQQWMVFGGGYVILFMALGLIMHGAQKKRRQPTERKIEALRNDRMTIERQLGNHLHERSAAKFEYDRVLTPHNILFATLCYVFFIGAMMGLHEMLWWMTEQMLTWYRIDYDFSTAIEVVEAIALLALFAILMKGIAARRSRFMDQLLKKLQGEREAIELSLQSQAAGLSDAPRADDNMKAMPGRGFRYLLYVAGIAWSLMILWSLGWQLPWLTRVFYNSMTAINIGVPTVAFIVLGAIAAWIGKPMSK